MGKRGVVSSLALAAIFFGLPEVALSETQAPAAQPVRDLQVSDIFLPPELGYVVETHRPTAYPNPPIIVHIQEAHTNSEAQQHLIGILERLIDRYGLKLILVEGGQGDVSLAYLRSYGPPDNRKQVVEKYLRAGIISGEEYLDIVSDYPLILWGVEQKDLYQQHLAVFMETEEFQGRLQPALASVREAVEALNPHLLHPALKELEAKTNAFEQEKLGLAEYVDFLTGLARRQGIPEGYPNLDRFLHVRKLEQAIRLDQVQEEQTSLTERLSRRVSEEELDRLITMALEMKAGKVKREDFYAHLEQLAGSLGLDLKTYPNLLRYIQYVKRSGEIRPTALADELEDLAADLRKVLASTPQSQQLNTIVEQLDLIEKLLDLRLDPEEHRRLKATNTSGLLSRWVSFLNEQLTRQGLPSRTFEGLTDLEAALPKLQRFYEAALARDEALVTNAMAKLSETKERLAVLITGGFHSPKITQLLKDQGVGIVVLAPKVSHATDERLYHAVLKYKSGHGSLDEVMALADQTASAAVSQ